MPTRIDWCDETINPLGHWCYGPGGTESNPKPCPYCYARKLAARGMRGCPKCQRFEKHTHFEQLEKLSQWRTPRTIFMQSMGDLFHDEVPDAWIQEVFAACERAPQHRYLFLTKNPKRYEKVFNACTPPNMWFGWSQTGPLGPGPVFASENITNSFVSVEPLLEPFSKTYIKGIGWAIVGAETGNRKDKAIPKREWVEKIAESCKDEGVPLFMKESLRELMSDDFVQEFPWEDQR